MVDSIVDRSAVRAEVESWPELKRKTIKVFKFATLLRLAIALALNKLNPVKTLRNHGVTSLRFGLACVLLSVLQKLSRKFMQARLNLCQDAVYFLSCGFSSLGLLAATPSDFRIFKVLLYSRATVAALKLGQETGVYECAKSEGDKRWYTIETLICIVSCAFLCYAYLFEVQAMPPSFVKTMTRACGLNENEKRFFDSLRAITEI